MTTYKVYTAYQWANKHSLIAYFTYVLVLYWN
jgi:hypothetical protein